jgi:hypothetical protein
METPGVRRRALERRAVVALALVAACVRSERSSCHCSRVSVEIDYRSSHRRTGTVLLDSGDPGDIYHILIF